MEYISGLVEDTMLMVYPSLFTLSDLIVREIVPIINSNSFFSLKPPIEENWVRGEKPVD